MSKEITTPWLKIKNCKENVLVIFGEMHDMSYVKQESALIESLKKMGKVDYLLLENAFDYVLKTNKDIERKIKEEDWMIGPVHYQLAIKNDLPVYGIDLDPDNEHFTKNLITTFKAREDRMVDVAKRMLRKGNCVLIVGDTHLRSIETNELGRASPLYTEFVGKDNVFIIRAPIEKREIDTKSDPKETYSWKDFSS